jgi:chromosome segregation ATPase
MTPQELLELRDHIAAFSSLMRGDFTAEIASLETQNEKLQEKLGLITTLDQVQQVKLEADAYATHTKATADEATAAAAKLTADAHNLDVASRAKDASLRAGETQLDQDKADFQAFVKEAHAALSAQLGTIQDQQSQLDTLKKTLADRADVLAAGEASVEQKLQALRKIAA